MWLWRPFSKCLAFVLRGRKVEFSLVHAFSSFLLLSYSKILFVSFQLLARTKLHDPNGQRVGPTVPYYDASIGYFSAPHLSFALLAICVLCVFVVLPALVLLLYPTRIFQRSLGCCSIVLLLTLLAASGHYYWMLVSTCYISSFCYSASIQEQLDQRLGLCGVCIIGLFSALDYVH